MKTFNSFSFGCRVNQAEKESLDRELSALGYQMDAKEPDVYILNTCAVTQKAEREARKHIHHIKRTFPHVHIMVTGCAATNWLKTGNKIKDIDVLIDNTNKAFLAELIDRNYRIQGEKTQNTPSLISKTASPTDILMRSKRTIIKIQDGCHRFCTFCIVPYLRGLPSSVPTQEVIKHVNELENFQEIILTAINTEAYGRDTGESFPALVSNIMKETHIARISFGSIHPWTCDDAFFKMYAQYAESPRFVDFFHIPLQSGCDATLSLMKRGYTRDEFITKLHTICELNAFAFIATDVIVGFLEESDQNFEDTYHFLEKTPISRFHVFRFSPREHTAGYHLCKRLSEPSPHIKQKRSKALRELSNKKYRAFQQKHLNQSFSALFLEKREGEYQHALLQNQMLALIHSTKDFTGEIKHVKIECYQKGRLFGKIA